MSYVRIFIVCCVVCGGCVARKGADVSSSGVDAGTDAATATDDDSKLNACGGTEQLYHLVDTDCEFHGAQWSADHDGTTERSPYCIAHGKWECDGSDNVTCFTKGNGDAEVCDGVDNDCDGKIDEGDDGKPAGVCSFGF